MMRRWLKRITIGLLGLALLSVLIWSVVLSVQPIAAQDNQAAVIISPQAGAQIFGAYPIVGTASTTNFERYKLEYASMTDSSASQWTLISEVKQQVTNGVLAQWKTTDVADGHYQLRLRVIQRNGVVIQTVVQNVIVANQQPTALPTELPSPTPIPPTVLPTAGPSSTPLIQQPPSSTLRPTVLAVAAPSIPPAGNGSVNNPASDPTTTTPQAVLVLQTLQNAFCTGVYLAIGGFAVLGFYTFVYTRTRPKVRRSVQELRSDPKD